MNDLKQAFLKREEIKRISKLEKIIDKNPDVNQKIKELKELQKKMVNAKEFHQEKQYAVYHKEYQQLYAEILDYPFVEEYMDLLSETNQDLQQVAWIIEKKINDALK